MITALATQKLIKCGTKPRSPKGIKRYRTTQLSKMHCRTNAGGRVKVTASRSQGRLFKLIRKKHGTQIRTKGRKFSVTLYWKAPATADYAAYYAERRYRIR
ncbi:MAG TPA: hypothetical protein DCQ04_16560 [Actinobacteria bacterium]|nr:hypothetical protein [Actinomycetota bacterium]